MMKSRLDITGMHCASCANSIEHQLQKINGVAEVSVNYAANTATVTHTETVSRKQLVAAVHAVGYDVAEDDTDADEHPDHAETRTTYAKRRMLAAWTITVPLALLMFTGYAGITFLTPVQVNVILLLFAAPLYWLFVDFSSPVGSFFFIASVGLLTGGFVYAANVLNLNQCSVPPTDPSQSVDGLESAD